MSVDAHAVELHVVANTELRIGYGVGGAVGLGNRLAYYSSLIHMPQFFACILILAVIGISIYVGFFWIGKKWASWET